MRNILCNQFTLIIWCHFLNYDFSYKLRKFPVFVKFYILYFFGIIGNKDYFRMRLHTMNCFNSQLKETMLETTYVPCLGTSVSGEGLGPNPTSLQSPFTGPGHPHFNPFLERSRYDSKLYPPFQCENPSIVTLTKTF